MNRKPSLPTRLSSNDYSIIKLKKFDNLQVAVMVDKENGGIAISYEDIHLDAGTKIDVENEIQAIISEELYKLIEGDQDGNL